MGLSLISDNNKFIVITEGKYGLRIKEMIHLLSYEEANERVEQAKRRAAGIEHDYTHDEIAKLIKQSKRERWSVTLELPEGSLWTTKWQTSKKAAKQTAVMFLHQNNIRCEVNGWLCNMADAMEEITFIGMGAKTDEN